MNSALAKTRTSKRLKSGIASPSCEQIFKLQQSKKLQVKFRNRHEALFGHSFPVVSRSVLCNFFKIP